MQLHPHSEEDLENKEPTRGMWQETPPFISAFILINFRLRNCKPTSHLGRKIVLVNPPIWPKNFEIATALGG